MKQCFICGRDTDAGFIVDVECVIALKDELSETKMQLRNARNELCLKCGRYHDAHKGACDGCKWKECVK